MRAIVQEADLIAQRTFHAGTYPIGAYVEHDGRIYRVAACAPDVACLACSLLDRHLESADLPPGYRCVCCQQLASDHDASGKGTKKYCSRFRSGEPHA